MTIQIDLPESLKNRMEQSCEERGVSVASFLIEVITAGVEHREDDRAVFLRRAAESLGLTTLAPGAEDNLVH